MTQKNLYHIFKIKLGDLYYKTEHIYTDQEFERIMDSVKWYMPFNLSAYHFQSGISPICNNPIINALPALDFSTEDLFNSHIDIDIKLWDKKKKTTFKVHKKWNRFVIVKDDITAPYGRVLQIDEFHTLVSPMTPVPITFKAAKEYVNKYHRHNCAPQGHKFSIALTTPLESEPVGIIIASIPKSRILAQDPYTLDINRCCSNPYYKNVCSKLYSLAIKTGKCMGYRKFITYTLSTESGSSLRAVGFKPEGIVPETPNGWDSPSRHRQKPLRYPEGEKIRWSLICA